jgi:hypothetical protein
MTGQPYAMQRLHRVPSTTIVYDLQFRFRCIQCGRIDGVKIELQDDRARGDNSKDKKVRLVVAPFP